MKNSTTKKVLSSCILLVYLFTQTIAIGGVVLCQSDAGHTAIEFAHGGECAESPFGNFDDHDHADASDHSVIQCELSHCGDCVDIPLSFDSSNERLQKSITLLKPFAQRAPPPFLAIHYQQKSFVAASLPRILPFNTFPSFLRTTVLLI